MNKIDNLDKLIKDQIAVERRYPFDRKAYLEILAKHYHTPKLSSFSCSATTCISGSKIINQHLARLIDKERNKVNSIQGDFAHDFVKYYKKTLPASKKILKLVLEKKGEAVTILWTFMPYVYNRLIVGHCLKTSVAINLIFRWVELTWYFNKIKFQKETRNLEIVPFSHIKMGYYLDVDSQDVTHSFTQFEANYLAEKIIDQLG